MQSYKETFFNRSKIISLELSSLHHSNARRPELGAHTACTNNNNNNNKKLFKGFQRCPCHRRKIRDQDLFKDEV